MNRYTYKKKLVSLDEAYRQALSCKERGEKLVFTNGCFDILHKGHIDYLRKSRQMGDILCVGLNSDASVRRLKGKDRPINSVHDRALLLEALDFVDYIVIFDEDTPLELIQLLRPDIYTKGGDYDLANIVGPNLGANIITDYGGTVQLVPKTDCISSTTIIKKIHRKCE